MNQRVLSILLLSVISLSISSCGDDDDTTGPGIDVPDTYTFERDGETSVSYSGQTTRIAMAEEIISALKNTDFAEAEIDAMFAHVEGNDDFSDTDLNASDKSVRSKTAASTDYFSANTTDASAIKSEFDVWIAEQVTDVYPNWAATASEGVAGQIQEAGGGSTRYVNAKGLELNQAFNKGLIGALMADQALNNYLGTAVLDAGTNVADNDNGTVADGKNYTNMEHKWDEAYGYVYGAATDGSNPVPTVGGDDSFLNKYVGRVESDSDFAGISQEIFDAFKLGRAAIVAGDYTMRDEQAAIIRQRVSEIIAIRAVYYLQQGKAGLEAGTIDYASVFHDLSEGYGFVYSLQFTRNPLTDEPFFSRAEVQGFIDMIYPSDVDENGFWDVTTTDLQSVSESIAEIFDFTVEQAGS